MLTKNACLFLYKPFFFFFLKLLFFIYLIVIKKNEKIGKNLHKER